MSRVGVITTPTRISRAPAGSGEAARASRRCSLSAVAMSAPHRPALQDDGCGGAHSPSPQSAITEPSAAARERDRGEQAATRSSSNPPHLRRAAGLPTSQRAGRQMSKKAKGKKGRPTSSRRPKEKALSSAVPAPRRARRESGRRAIASTDQCHKVCSISERSDHRTKNHPRPHCNADGSHARDSREALREERGRAPRAAAGPPSPRSTRPLRAGRSGVFPGARRRAQESPVPPKLARAARPIARSRIGTLAELRRASAAQPVKAVEPFSPKSLGPNETSVGFERRDPRRRRAANPLRVAAADFRAFADQRDGRLRVMRAEARSTGLRPRVAQEDIRMPSALPLRMRSREVRPDVAFRQRAVDPVVTAYSPTSASEWPSKPSGRGGSSEAAE